MLALVGEVVAQWRGAPLLVLCLSRNMPNLSKRVPARLRRHTIELDPLLQSDAERLLEWLDPVAARDHAVRTPLLRRAEGNPFYLDSWWP